MSDQVSGNRNKQPWLRYCSDQNEFTQTPFPFNGPDPSAVNGRGEHLFNRHQQPINNFPKPPPTTNLRFVMWGRGGAKAYFRFHGGIGDGRTGCRIIEENTAARPLQLFEALHPAHFHHIEMLKKACEGGFVNPVTGNWVPHTEASSGTGMFLPKYPLRIGLTRPGGRKNNGGMCLRGGGHDCHHGPMKQEQDKRLMEEEEGKNFDEIPIELLLPPEWTY